MHTILVIDDDPKIVKVIKIILEKAGYEVLTANGGYEGLKLYKKYEPEVVLTDVIMEEGEGVETAIEIKKINPNAQIIAMSGGGKYPAQVYLSMIRAFGAEMMIQKPIQSSKLLEIVELALYRAGLVEK